MAQPAVFRLPKMAYVVVLFLLFGTIPLAFTRGVSTDPALGWNTLTLLVPLLALVYVARTGTLVTGRGIVVRAAFGTRALPWSTIRGLSVTGTSVYAVLADGAVRLPCVRQVDLAAVARASDGRLPHVDDPKPKFAPQRRRRR